MLALELHVPLTLPAGAATLLAPDFFAALLPGLLTEWGPKDFVTDSDGGALVRTSPSGDAWFGTDNIGRDVYSRVIHGVRPILQVAPLATIIAIVVGTLLGMTMGYFLGWVDEILSRIIESILSIPSILMAILVIFTFGRTDTVVTGTIALLFVPPVARTVRAATLGRTLSVIRRRRRRSREPG